ncbi:unnamed protein product [Staurois parvus]|uniref:Uncharacterized protein n=1 Tax=Staurois parvus TaxID=386267 RepID=A0ABN9CUN6_9NEOB|nr:unnamed protein product [Staurois parvus]
MSSTPISCHESTLCCCP